jgi:hypothetical protein
MSEAANIRGGVSERGPGASQLNPDPTERTLDQSRREIAMLDRIVDSKLHGKEEVAVLLKEFNAAIVAHIRLEMFSLKELEEEKFKAINGQFSQRDLALLAAFAAQEKLAIAQQQANNDSAERTQNNTAKQLEAQGGSIKAVEKTLGENTNDLKERIQASEGRLSQRITAIEAEKFGSRGGITAAIGVAAVLVVLLAIAVDVVVHLVR